MVTRRGTNDWRATARYLIADSAWQSSFDPLREDLGDGQEELRQGDRIDRIEEYGVEGGGPLLRDRLWLWGFYGRNDIGRLTIDDVENFTRLENYGLKLNAQLTPGNSAVAFFHFGDKIVDGRLAGPTHPQPTTVDQKSPTIIYKLEDSQVVSSSLFFTGLLSYVDGGFGWIPRGGLDGPNAVLDQDFIWQNNFRFYDTERDQAQARIDGSYFFTTGELGRRVGDTGFIGR